MSEQRDEQFSKYWFIGTNPEDHVKHLEKYIKMGFQHIDVVSSSPDEIKTLKMYAKNVLPYMHSTIDFVRIIQALYEFPYSTIR